MTSVQHPTRFVVMAGLPGTGKSTLAEALAKRLGGVVLSKDRVRAALFPGAAVDYSDEQDDFCMAVLLLAAQRIGANHATPFIFIDGRTFSRQSHVLEVVRCAAEANASYRILHLVCPDELALERIRRCRGEHIAANRDEDLYWELKALFQRFAFPKLDVDTSRPLEECVAECVEYLGKY